MASARKIMQDQPQKALDEFRELETAIARRRTQLKQKREKLFFDFCRTTRQEADKIITTISGKELFSVRAAFEGLKNRFADRMQQSPFMPEHIRRREKKDWDLVCKRFEAALKKETILQQLQKPASFDNYIATLEKSRYDEPAVAMIYQRALAAKDLWVRECKNYRGFIPEKSDIADASAKFNDGFFKQDLARIVPETRRSAGLRDFFSQIRKLSKLREIVFSTSAGEDYFFYTEKEIVFERLSRPRRLNISFEDMEKGAFYTFKFDFAAQKDPFVPVNVPKDLSYKMPEKFAALCGQTTLDSKFEVPFWPGRTFAEKFHALGSDGPGICENLQQARVWVSGADNITNPFLKEMFTLRLLEALCACSPFFTEGKEALARLKDQYVQRQSNWRSPQSQPSRKQETEQVNELLAQLDLARIVEARKLRADFLCAFHARKLVPAGVVKELSGEKVQISYFLKKTPVEMMVMDQQGLVLLSPALRQGIAAGEDRRHLFLGQVLWTFGDDMRTVDFVRKWIGEARKLNIELGVKPRIFPGGLTIGGIR